MIGKRQHTPSELIATSSRSEILGSSEGVLSISEVSEYFNYLKKADLYFKDVCERAPESFLLFSKEGKFPELKSLLKAVNEKGKRFERKKVEINKIFIDSMKRRLNELMEGPSKKVCLKELGPGGDWHEAFGIMMKVLNDQNDEAKARFRQSLLKDLAV